MLRTLRNVADTAGLSPSERRAAYEAMAHVLCKLAECLEKRRWNGREAAHRPRLN